MADKQLSKVEKQRLKEREKFERERDKWKKQESKKRKRKHKQVDMAPIIIKTVAIIVSIVVVLGFTVYFGASYGMPGRFMPALSIGKITVYEPEWAFYFYNQYSRHAEMAQQYEQYAAYGLNYGLSLYQSPFAQKNVSENKNWGKLIAEQTNEALQNMRAVYAEAKKLNIQLSEKDQKAINDRMDEMKATANGYAMSVSAYLRLSNNPAGVTERFYRNLFQREMLVSTYETQKRDEYRARYSDEDLQKEYDPDKAAYDFVDLRLFPFAKESGNVPDEGESEEAFEARLEATNRGVKKEASDFLDKIATEQEFIAAADKQTDKEASPDYDAASATNYIRTRKSTLDQYTFNEEVLSTWVYSKDRKAGDKTLFETDSYFYAVYMARPAYQIATVDFYTINVPFDTSSGDDETNAQNKADSQAAAQQILADWEEAGRTKEAFVAQLDAVAKANQVGMTEEEIAEDNAAAIADGEEEAGLTTKVKPGDTEFKNLEDWLFAASRKAGQAAVIETTEGFKVVYLSKQNAADFTWKYEIGDRHVSEDYEAYLNGLKENYPIKENKVGMWFGHKTARALCDSFVANYIQNYMNSAADEEHLYS